MSKRQAIKAQRVRRQQQQRKTMIMIVSAIALVVAGLLAFPSLQAALAPVGEIARITPVPRPMADFNAMGDPNAPVKIEEFSDFQCPFCKRFADETQLQIVEAYVATGKVYFVYYPYGPGGNWIGPESESSARAAFCAGDQDMFWEYHDILFANHTGENVGDFTDKRLLAFASSLNMDMDQFGVCFDSNKYVDRLNEGIIHGRQAGIGPTPSFLINGKIIEGALPFSAFQQEIEAALAAAGTQ